MNSRKTLRFIAEISIFTALGLVLDYVCGLFGGIAWSNGGSVSIAMVPIFLMGYKYGPKGGFLTGLLVGTIQILWGSSAGVLGALLDYVFAYSVLGVASFFRPFTKSEKRAVRYSFICLSILIACICRCAFHIASGMILYECDFLYSLTYNGSFLLISMPLCMILCCLLNDILKQFMNE